MNKLKNNILKELEQNKFGVGQNNKSKNKTNLTAVPSLAFMLLTPIVFVFLLDAFFHFNHKMFLSLFIFSVFCSFYNIYKTIHSLYNKADGDKDD